MKKEIYIGFIELYGYHHLVIGDTEKKVYDRMESHYNEWTEGRESKSFAEMFEYCAWHIDKTFIGATIMY